MRRAAPLLIAIALLAVGAAWLLRPLAPVRAPRYHGAESYDDAVGRLFELLSRDTLALHTGCGTTALLTGARAPRAFVLLHGITNCPLQFLALAESLRAGGDNVLLPRLDHHGLEDRMTTDLANARAEETVALVTECVGIARGLGDTLVVCGLSTSGVATAWAAVHLEDVDRAVVIAPAFAPPWKPGWTAPILTRLALRLGNRFVWWDDEKHEELPGPVQCYPRFSTRAMGEAYRLGEDVMRSLGSQAPRAGELAVITTQADDAVDNTRAHRLSDGFRAAGARVREHEFAANDSVVHDMVDPVQVGARIGLTYPVLLAMLRGQRVPAP
jgi:pimeloyl-ACP methyl ester carboxylesterase